ncbi:cell division protein FtsA [Candidatus Syntrophocurvum alkaliphilum]|uniref:cell division protein FtsA n=1 Tax=Candidatus Syntrophocurvum alkaliphilum TaxID=2293317 RepID=UPI002433FF67|nr:cell division protein FtsA [Candidatus Syntrophocurvum alkaliphilum]
MVSLDVGTSSIKATLGEVGQAKDVSILGISQVPSLGLRKGNIVDIESTAKSIDTCLNDLERLTGTPIDKAIIGFSGASVYALNNHAVVAVGNPTYEITKDDKERVLQSARNMALPPDKTIVQTIERQYIVDGYDGVKDPVGMVGSRLEVEVVIIIATTAAIQNLQRSINRINLDIDNLVYTPLLTAESVLTPTEKEMGVVIVDIGGGTTNVTVFEQGSMSTTTVLPVGGEFVTKDIAIILRTSIEEANRVKERYGVASTELAKTDVLIDIHNLQGSDVKQVNQYMVAEIIYARIEELAQLIYEELQVAGVIDKLPGGIVLSGGGAQLTGIVEVLEELLELPVRLGIPENIRGVPTDFNKPQNAVVLGALNYKVNQLGSEVELNYSQESLLDKIIYWFKDLFR